jgi:prepilin-type N-terminal cleavage/methylation domain-containing protein
MNHKNKGFSLIELLASIFIVSLVIGVGIYFTINIINQSQDKSNTLTINNVKSIAKTYVEENSKEVVWYYAEEENQSKTCISLQSLINKGYLKEDILENNNISNFIIVSKDTDGNFLSETFDTNNYCLNQSTTIKIPTSKNNCNTLTYKGEEQELTKDYEDYNYTFKLENDENPIGIDAGTYQVYAKLNAP